MLGHASSSLGLPGMLLLVVLALPIFGSAQQPPATRHSTPPPARIASPLQEAETLIQEARQTAWDLAGVELHCRVVAGNEVEAIVAAAREGFELVVVGFAGHTNIFGRIMGSTAQTLSRLSPCSVLIVK